MLIAENLVRDGVATGHLFNQKLTEFVREMGFTKLIEAGTYLGTGSTSAILRGLQGRVFDFITIEADPKNYQMAKDNLGEVHGLHMINGLTVGKPQLPTVLDEDFPGWVITDHQPKNRLKLYLNEVRHNVPDHQLDRALAAFEYKPEFVILDSAGHMGWVEFEYLMERVQGGFYLALDDTGHRKHYKTLEYIRANPNFFEIIWEVRSHNDPRGEANGRDKFGSAIVKVA